MNTTVITVDPVDYGAGPTDRNTFAACRWHVDGGTLHIVREGGRGNVAAFAAGTWSAAIEGGSIVASAR